MNKAYNCDLHILFNFFKIVEVAVEKGYITNEEIDRIYKWHSNPKEYVF